MASAEDTPRRTRAGTVLTPIPDRAGQGATQLASNQQQPAANQNGTVTQTIIVQSSALDTHVPAVRRVNEADIKTRFPHQHITPIEGEPTFEQMQHLEQQLAANALTAKVGFGGGKKGCLGVVYKNEKFRVEAGQDWVVPATQGAFPTFPPGVDDNTKKQIIAKFLKDEYGIQVVDTVEELLKKPTYRGNR